VNHTLFSPRGNCFVCRRGVVMWGSNWGRDKNARFSASPRSGPRAIRSGPSLTVALFVFLLAPAWQLYPAASRATFSVILTIAVSTPYGGALLGRWLAFGLQFVSVGRSIVLGYTTAAFGLLLLLGCFLSENL